MDQSDHPESVLNRTERNWMRVWFWMLYLLTPLTAAAAHVATEMLAGTLPRQFRPWVRMINQDFGIWAPVLCGAMGAGYCLARLQGRRAREEVLAFTILTGVVLTISYFLLLCAGCLVVRLASALAV